MFWKKKKQSEAPPKLEEPISEFDILLGQLLQDHKQWGRYAHDSLFEHHRLKIKIERKQEVYHFYFGEYWQIVMPSGSQLRAGKYVERRIIQMINEKRACAWQKDVEFLKENLLTD